MSKGRPLSIEWQESERELYEEYIAQTGVAQRTKAQFLWLVRGGKSIRESSQIAGIQERVGQRYLKWYRQGGIEEVMRRKHGGNNGNQPAFLDETQLEQLKAEANAGNLKTIWEGIEWVKQAFQVEYSYEGMRSVYKRLKLKKKVPRKQHIKSDPTAQADWKKGAWSTN